MINSTIDIFAESANSPGPWKKIPIREEQFQELRDAFAAAGINSMDERRAIIESYTARPITTIRDPMGKDGRASCTRRIAARSLPSKPSSGSAWDNRDEETWIDKL